MSSKFLAALALAKSSDATPVADGKYRVKIVSARIEPGTNVDRVLRLDLETMTAGQFIGRRQVKNQPLTTKSVAYIAALLEATGNSDIATNTALGEAFERGDESAMRLFVGKEFNIDRKTKSDGTNELTIVA